MGLIPINEPSGVVPDSFLNKFEPFVCGDVVLVLYNGVLQATLRSGKVKKLNGITVANKLIDYSSVWESTMNEIIDKHNLDDFEALVVISKKAWSKYIKSPAYLSYIIGHELGHAKSINENIRDYIHGCIIQEFINEASEGAISGGIQFPHEVLCDEYGILVAESIYSRDALNNEIKSILKYHANNEQRLNQLLELEGNDDFSNLRKMLIEISLPYKDRLIEIWKQAKKSPFKNMAHFVNDYEAMFF